MQRNRKDKPMPVTASNVTDPIFERARKQPDAVAVIEGPHTISAARFAALIAKCTAHLQQVGIRPGDRVGVRMTNSADHLILSMALLRMGAVKFELSAMADPSALETVTRKFGLGTLFLEPPMKLYKGARCIPVDIGWRTLVEACDGDVRCDGTEEEPCFVNLAYDEAGMARAIPVSHGQVIGQLAALEDAYGHTGLFSKKDPGTYLQFGSLAQPDVHTFTLFQLMRGAATAMVPDFAKFYDIVRHVHYFDDAVAMVSAPMCEVFVACAQKNAILFPRMRAIASCGGPLKGELKKAMVAKVTPNYYEVYGTAGSGWLTVFEPADMPRRSEGIGKPVPGLEVEIVDHEGKALGKGKPGFLRCRGEEVSRNFLLADDRSAEHEGFRDGWYYTGDIAQQDGNGFLFLKGKSSDVIHRDGYPVIPAEVEAVLNAHGSVKEAVVIGLDAKRGGQEVVALVTPKDEPQHDALVEHCMAKLPAEKRPRAIAYTDELPRDAAGRINLGRVRSRALKALKQAGAIVTPAGAA
jgi:acyl-CoA synthetase (AMP-forming)/AMP-acid ligase II